MHSRPVPEVTISDTQRKLLKVRVLLAEAIAPAVTATDTALAVLQADRLVEELIDRG